MTVRRWTLISIKHFQGGFEKNESMVEVRGPRKEVKHRQALAFDLDQCVSTCMRQTKATETESD